MTATARDKAWLMSGVKKLHAHLPHWMSGYLLLSSQGARLEAEQIELELVC